MSNLENKDLNKPSPSRQSNVSKEPYAYTPSWMSPAERAKLKARIRKIKKKEEEWGMKKEEGTLVQKSPSNSPSHEPDPPKGEEMQMSDVEDKPASPLRDQPSATSKEPSLTDYDSTPPKTSSTDMKKPSKSNKDKRGKPSRTDKDSTPSKKSSSDTKNSSKSNKDSKESVSKKKSKEELAMAKKNQKAKHPKAAHANPSGNRVEDEAPWIPHPRDTIEAHLWATDFRHFDPQLYAFKTPEKLSTKKPVVAECPPFWVLNDHTIAVAWKLYCKEADRSDLGIVALQWSREFVSAMKDERGEYPNAIKHLLDAIEDGLIFRYSRAAEDSKKAHQKDDDISYASSDSVFKPPTEVSYTLKDIMSRNFPGRKFGDDPELSTTVRKDDKNASAMNRTLFVPTNEGDTMNQKDLVALLKQYKIEQEARIKQEMNASREIDRLLQQAQAGTLPVAQGGRRRHLDFDVPDESEPSMTSSKKKPKDGSDLKKTTSAASNKSTKSNASGKSAASEKSGKSASSGKSGKSEKSRGSMSSVASDYDTMSDHSMTEPDTKAEEKAMKKKSKDNVTKKSSKDSVASRKSSKGDEKAKKSSKDSVASQKSSKGVEKSKKSSKDSVASQKSSKGDVKAKKSSKESVSSQKSSKGDAKAKKGSQGSASSGKKGSKGSKGSQ